LREPVYGASILKVKWDAVNVQTFLMLKTSLIFETHTTSLISRRDGRTWEPWSKARARTGVEMPRNAVRDLPDVTQGDGLDLDVAE
jgi:hypothetical protein